MDSVYFDQTRQATRLVLWDIDKTLLDSRGYGRRTWNLVYQELFGSALSLDFPIAGRTDHAIIKDILFRRGITDDKQIAEFHRAVSLAGRGNINQMLQQGGRVMPGAAEALRALAGRPGVVQSVLTGNLREVGIAKLTAIEVHGYLDLEIGAYGDEHEVRAELVDVARILAFKKYCSPFAGRATVLVGDTPSDVEAGLARDTMVVGVATGPYSLVDLQSAGAHVVLPDLIDTNRVVNAIIESTNDRGV